MKFKIKRILAVMLVFCMMMGMVPNMLMTAHAAGYADAIESITIDGTAITNVTGTQEGTNWSYDGTRTVPRISLDNYNGDAIYVKGKSDAVTVGIEIRIKGDCSITTLAEAIKLDANNAGDIIISTDAGSTLTTNSWHGIYNAAKKNPRVEFSGSGKVKINANGGSGIWAYQNPITDEFSVAGSITVGGLVYVEANAPGTVASYGYSKDHRGVNNVNFYVSGGASVKFTKTDASNPNPVVFSPETITVYSGYTKSLSEDGTVFRLYKPVAYTISFEGSNTLIPKATTNVDGTLSSLPTPTAPIPGQEFVGWYTAKEGGEKVTTDTIFTSDTTLYARWNDPVVYTISFEGSNTLIPKATTNVDGTLSSLPTPTALIPGQEFVGWYTAKEGGEKVTTDTIFTSDTTLYARWNDPVVVYTISFEGSNTLIPKATTNEDGTLSSLPTPTAPIPGQEFVGWYTAKEGGEKVTTDTIFTSDTTLYARWNDPATYTVDAGAFPADSGTITGTGTYSAGSSVTLTATPKEGYRFVAWRDLANPSLSTDATYTFTVNEDTVLLAMFEEVETPPATYTVDAGAFPADSGTITGTGTYSAGSSVTLTATPKEGYRFVAWRDLANPSLSTDATYTFTVNEDTVLLAMFEEVETPTEIDSITIEGLPVMQIGQTRNEYHSSIMSNRNDGTYKVNGNAYADGFYGNLETDGFEYMDENKNILPVDDSVYTEGTYYFSEAFKLTEGYEFADVVTVKVTGVADANVEVMRDGEWLGVFVKYVLTESAPTEYDITVNGGTASVGAGTAVTKATAGTVITLTVDESAIPAGKVFDKWEVVSGGVTVADGKFTMPANAVEIRATYKDAPVVPTEYDITVTGGTASANKAVAGTVITLSVDESAIPAGKVFDKWEVVSGGVTITDGKFTMPANAVEIRATYKDAPVVPTEYDITVTGGTASANKAVAGTVITLTVDESAIPAGKVFDKWEVVSGGVTVTDGKFTMPANAVEINATYKDAPVSHTCDIKPVAKDEPSCTEGGKEAYYKCEGCGKFYEDALGAKEITDLANWGNLPKLGHTESDWKSDKDNHWKECTVTACGVIIEDSKAAHKDDNKDGKCDVCEYNVGLPTTPDDDKPNDNPQTGDNSNMFLWIALLFISGAGVVATTVFGKKKFSVK